MPDKKIEINQTGNRITMELVEGERRSVLASDKDGAVVGHRWWLNPVVFNLREELKTWGCSEAQILQALESLTSGGDTHLVLDV